MFKKNRILKKSKIWIFCCVVALIFLGSQLTPFLTNSPSWRPFWGLKSHPQGWGGNLPPLNGAQLGDPRKKGVRFNNPFFSEHSLQEVDVRRCKALLGKGEILDCTELDPEKHHNTAGVGCLTRAGALIIATPKSEGLRDIVRNGRVAMCTIQYAKDRSCPLLCPLWPYQWGRLPQSPGSHAR